MALLTIKHETTYRYTAPLSYTIQQLRLTPRTESHQRVLSWRIDTPGQCHAFIDAFGNPSHLLTMTERHGEILIVAHGVVEVTHIKAGRLSEANVLSPLVFTVPTPLTEANESIKQLSHAYLSTTPHDDQLLGLASAICNALQYQSGVTGVTSTAAEALQIGSGVCQDHAQLFIACCHVHGIPARYVSGYIDPGDTDHAESHAWVDVWMEAGDSSGWVSIDVTHARFTNDAYCRLAIGRDYESASPVRGVRRGGGIETLAVKVEVHVA